MRNALLTLALLALSPRVQAAPAKAAPGKTRAVSSKGKLDKIRQLLQLKRQDEAGQNQLQALKARLPPAQAEQVAQLIHPEELFEQIVAIYDRHFTEGEIDGLIDFYSSPLGQRLIEESPSINSEINEAAQRYALDKLAHARPTSGPVDVPKK